MYCSPLIPEYRTRVPAGLRNWIGRRLSGPPPGDATTRWKAAIFQVARLGDFVLSLGAIRTLLDAWGEEQCGLVVSTAAAGLAAREFPRTPQIVIPTEGASLVRQIIPAWWRHRKKLRGVRAEHLVCLTHQRDLYREVALSWITAEHRHAFVRATYPTAAKERFSLELCAHQQLVEKALRRTLSSEEILPRLRSVSATPGDYLLVCPFTSEAVKSMPVALLVHALRAWRKRSDARIVVCAAPADADRLQGLMSHLQAAGLEPIESIVTPNLDAFLRTIAAAGAILGMDSAAAHVAIALDQPVCVLTGGGSYGLCLPWWHSPRQVFLSHHVPCWHCGWRCNQSETFCITQVAPEKIAAALPAL